MDQAHAKCFEEAQLAGLSLRNRLLKAATFEGKTPGGVPGEAMTEFHRRIGEGGVAMTNLAYCASEADGRLSADMMHMHEGLRGPLRSLIESVKTTGTRVCGQLGHCGNFSKNRQLSTRRALGPSAGLSPIGMSVGRPLAGALTLEQIGERVRGFGAAAAFMKSVGFDAIEIHFGHGYAISQFISPKTNKRHDRYGGALHRRMRFGLEVLEAVRSAVGDDFPLLGKISMTDGVRGGVSYDDAVEIAALLEKGGLDLIVCSGGTSSMNPMLLFRGDSIKPGIVEHEPSAMMRLGIRVFGGLLFKNYPYEELYFREQALRIRERVDCGVCYVGGACTSESFATLMRDGFDFIQLGRALLYDPDLPRRAQADRDYVNGCSHCNRCAPLIDAEGGILCVERPRNFAGRAD
jgi:2,4-dienoyl-CoA reductase-like NADH-dependent reductase (Old Yellow Enzyme family)